MQPIHALPSSAQDGEVVAVTTIDDKGDGDVAWTLYRLAYAAGGSIRATRAFKLERIPPCDGESTFNDGHHRYRVIDTNSVPILAATIVAYLGVRGQDSMTLVSEAEIRALDRSMGSGRLVSSLPTLQSIPLQRQVSDAEVVDASATWLSNRSGTSVGAALDEQSLRAVPVAPAQVRNHRRPWLVVFFTMLRHYNGRCVVPNIFITAAFVLLFRVVAIAGHSIANNEVPIQNGRASAVPSRCSVTYTTPELRPAVHVFSNCTATPTAATQTNYTVGNESITMSTTVVDVAPFVLLGYQTQPPPFVCHLWDGIDSTHVKSNNSHVASLVVVSFLSLASIILAMCHGESKQRAWLRVLGCSDITTLSLNLFMGFVLNAVVAVAMYYLSHMASIKEWLLVSVCFTASTVCFATLWGTIAPPGTKMFGTVVLFILPLAICCFSPSGAFETTLMVLSPSVAAWYGLTQAIEPIAFHFRFSQGCIAAVLVLQAVVFGIGAHLCAAGPRLTMAAARDVLRQLSRSCCGRRSRHSRGLHRSIGDASRTHDDDDDEELDSAAPAIELREVQKAFGDHRVLNLSMTVQRGESVAVLGHNGAGKSTLLSVLMGLEKADTYSVARVFGFDVNADIDNIRQNIGVCPQQDALFIFSSARQNVALVAGLRGVTATDDEIEALLAYLGVPASSILMNCSAGLARRVSVACAFIGNPALVLLDEPTTGIDDASRQKIWELIAMYQRRGTTIVMTTHAMEEAEVACHRIAIVAGGDIAATGVASELKRRYSPGYRLILDHAKRRDSRVDADGGSSSVFQEAMASALLTKLHEGATLESVVPDASHTFLLPGPSQDYSALLHAIESNKQQLGVASYMLLDPSLDDVFVEVQRRHAYRGDAMALSGSETLATALTDLDRPEVWRAFEARALETVSLAQDFFAQLQLMARVRQTRLRRHVLSDVTLGIVVPLLLLAVGFNLLDMTFAPLPSVCAIVTPEGSAPLATSLSNVLLAAPRPICGEFFQAVFPACGGSRLTTLAVPRRHIGFMPEHLQAVIYVSDNFKTLGVALDKDVDPASAATFRSNVLRKVDLFVRHLRNGSAEPLPRLDIVVPGANLPTSSLEYQSRMLLRLIFIAVFGYASLAVYHLFADSVCHRVVSRSDVLGPQGCTMATATNAAMDGAISGLIFGCALAMGLLATHGISAIEAASVVLGTVAFSFCMRGGSWLMCFITPLAFVAFSAMRADLLAALMSPTVAWSLVVMGMNGSHFNAPLAPAAILVLVHVPLCAYLLRGSFAVPVTKHINKVERSELPSTTAQAEPDVIAEYQRVVRESDAYGRPRDAVAFCNVSFEYPAAGTLTIDSLTWGVGRGRILGFVGPNGTGKTTTLKLALKQLKPLAGGGVTYGSLGRDFDGAMLWRVVSFGVCPQDDEDMSESYTALDYMRLFVEFRLGRGVFDDKEKGGFENLDAEQWRRYAVASLQMLDIPLDVGVGSMSGGKRRLLTTALALFCGASVIVLDEPTNGVDPVTRVLMWRVIRWWTWARQRTVIMVTHSMFEAERLCDTVGVLVGGSLRCIGTPSQLRAKYGTGYVAEVTINAETNVPLLDEEMKAHFGEVASKVTTRGGGLLRSYNIGAAPSMASAYQEVQTLALSCRAERVAVSRPSLQQAYRTMTR